MHFQPTACLLVFLALSNQVHSLPDDLKPRLIILQSDTSDLPAFIGDGPNGDHKLNLQEIKVIDGKVVIGSRDAAFVLSQSLFKQATGSIPYEQVIVWNADKRPQCLRKKSLNEECRNYIRVISLFDSRSILMCGTNAGYSSCRIYNWSGSHLDDSYKNMTKYDQFLVPDTDTESLTYRFIGGYMFTATRLNTKEVKKQVLIRVGLNLTGSDLQMKYNSTLPLLTNNWDSDWFIKPTFIAMTETDDKVLLFLKEEAVDGSDESESVVYSRVVQVCKNDLGGSKKPLDSKWTTFFKARLNCSVPGNRPFYFNELQHITDVKMFEGKPTIFATFTTPHSHIRASAVCAYTIESIEEALGGDFREKSTSGSCWKDSVRPPRSYPSPSSCKKVPVTDDASLHFINSHQLMAAAVQPIDHKPLFTMLYSMTLFTAIGVETNVTVKDNKSVSVMYIGTNDGKLLVVVSSELHDRNNTVKDEKRKTVFALELNVFQPQRCNTTQDRDAIGENEEHKRVQNITLIEGFVLVSFKYCIISVRKKACWYYQSKNECSSSGNPFCGWDTDVCEPVTKINLEYIEQDVFKNVESSESAKLEGQNCTQGKKTESCSINTTLPIILGVVTAVSILLLLLSFLHQFKHHRSKQQISRNQEQNHKKQKKNLLVRRSQYNAPVVTIEAARPIRNSFSDQGNIGLPQPINNVNMNSNCEIKFFSIAKQSSGDSSSWSEDFSSSKNQSNTSLPEMAEKNPYMQKEDSGENSSPTCAANIDMNKYDFCLHRQPFTPFKIKLGSADHKIPVPVSGSSKRIAKTRIVTNPNYKQISSRGSCLPDKHELSYTDNSNISFERNPTRLTTFFANKSKRATKIDTSDSINKSQSNKFLHFPSTTSSTISRKSSNVDASSVLSNTCSSFSDKTVSDEVVDGGGRTRGAFSPKSTVLSFSEESTSSGFVSPSPEDLSLHKSLTAAKGILSAQYYFASHEIKQKKDKEAKELRLNGCDEHDYDEVYEPTSSNEKDSNSAFISSQQSWNLKESEKRIVFPIPEYQRDSKDNDYNDFEKSSSSLSPNISLPDAGVLKRDRKRSVGVLKSITGNSEKMKDSKFESDECFTSPAYDENPVAVKVEGWKEIEYSNNLLNYYSSNCNHFCDDYQIDAKAQQTKRFVTEERFYTLKPKGRMRQMASNLNNPNNKWNLQQAL